MATISRRGFLQTSTAGSASMLLLGTRASGKIIGANDRLRIAVAGLNGRGQSHIGGWMEQPNVEIAYLIDPDKKVLSSAMKGVESKLGEDFKAKGIADVREALDDKNLDAISVATPNHWHSLITIWAAQAGKHVYVEKPMSHDVAEGRIAVEAQQKYGVVIQHGTQVAAMPRWPVCMKRSRRTVRQTENLIRLLLQTSRQYRIQTDLCSTGKSGLESVARSGSDR